MNIHSFVVKTGLVWLGLMAGAGCVAEHNPVYMANGVKIGEVDSTSAIVWTRLTKHPERNIDGKPFPKQSSKDARLGQSFDLPEMQGIAVGIGGQVRITYRRSDEKQPGVSTLWQDVIASSDFTRQIKLEGLRSGTAYSLIAEGRPANSRKASYSVEGSFRTAPSASVAAPASFTVVTGQDYPRRDDKVNGHKIYPQMQRLGHDFFVHTGDIEYYDKPGPFADNRELARFKWNRIYALPYQRSFHNNTASYFIKDDHDTVKNDCWPEQNYGDLTWQQGLAIFREQVPMGPKTYRTIRWGKDLQIWLVEGRDFRSPNNMADGPAKTIWGKEQKEWFFDTVKRSDAAFRVLISPTPIVGPDRGNKNDNHANEGFTHEGNELRKFIGKQRNMFVICGDRHWQYVSVDPETGVREYSCGPTTDEHAGGFKEKDRSSMHRYLKIKGGFLSVTVDRKEDVPSITFRHYGVDGTIYNEDVVSFRKGQL